ncbi:MAG TPA: hypothetical protein PLW48_08835 [Alphaproteobacteria bacterium]|nr:hypothetical protein [Alphaproteobacteria bacterium]
MRKAFLTALLPFALMTSGCDGMAEAPKTPEQKKAEAIEQINREFGLQVRDVTLPKAFYDLPAGQYEVTIKGKDGQDKDCIANVIQTTHGRTNVILNCP